MVADEPRQGEMIFVKEMVTKKIGDNVERNGI